MGKIKDIAGKKYGRLTAIKLSNDHKKWVFKCDCGNVFETFKDNVVRGRTKSCGCLKNEKFTDLTDKKFGRLTVNKMIGRNKYGQSIWECNCQCGNSIPVMVSNLLAGHSKSCGCYATEIARKMQKTAIEQDRLQSTRIGNIATNKLWSTNTTGIRGVSYYPQRGKYVAQIVYQGKTKYLGSYKTLEDASKARKEAEEKYFQPIIEEYEELKKEPFAEGSSKKFK